VHVPTRIPCRRALLPRLLVLFATATLAAGDPPPPEPGPEIGPELEPEPRAADAGGVTPADVSTIDKYLMQAVTRNIASDEAASLRRIRQFLQAEIDKARRPKDKDEEEDLLVRLRRALQKRVQTSKHARPARERLTSLYVLQEDWEAALEHLTRIGPVSDRDLCHPLLLGYVYLHLGDYAKADACLARLDSLLHEYRTLQVSAPVFCSEIRGYRLYTPAPDACAPGQDVLVYVELQGVTFAAEAGGMASCSMAFGLAIKDDAQREIWSQPEFGNYAPNFRGPVRDLHATISVRIPNHLAEGRYHLFVTCTDVRSKKTGEAAAAFRVAGPARTPPAQTVEPTDDPAAAEQRRRLTEEQEFIRQHQQRQTDLFREP